jgi:hypothetical protein
MRDIIANSTVETLLEILLLILINVVQKNRQFLLLWILWIFFLVPRIAESRSQ